MAILETKNLTYTYGVGTPFEKTAVENVNLSVEKGAFVGVIGHTGSGKSTLLNMLGGLDRPTSGSVTIRGKELLKMKDEELTIFRRRNIGFVFQKYQLLPEYTIWDNVCMPLYIAHQNPDRDYIQQILKRAGLWERRMDYPEELSGGEQQRVAIARAMVAKPEIILADEPTGNLDYRTGQEIMRMLRASREMYLQTIVMVTHDMESANYADRIVILEDGKLR